MQRINKFQLLNQGKIEQWPKQFKKDNITYGIKTKFKPCQFFIGSFVCKKLTSNKFSRIQHKLQLSQVRTSQLKLKLLHHDKLTLK